MAKSELDDMSEELEAFVDEHGMYAVLQTLSDICHGKADHLRSNWQDEDGAKVWDKDATTIARASLNLDAAY